MLLLLLWRHWRLLEPICDDVLDRPLLGLPSVLLWPVCSWLLLLLRLVAVGIVLLRRRCDDVERGPVLLVPAEHTGRSVTEVVGAHVSLARHRQLVLGKRRVSFATCKYFGSVG